MRQERGTVAENPARRIRQRNIERAAHGGHAIGCVVVLGGVADGLVQKHAGRGRSARRASRLRTGCRSRNGKARRGAPARQRRASMCSGVVTIDTAVDGRWSSWPGPLSSPSSADGLGHEAAHAARRRARGYARASSGIRFGHARPTSSGVRRVSRARDRGAAAECQAVRQAALDTNPVRPDFVPRSDGVIRSIGRGSRPACLAGSNVTVSVCRRSRLESSDGRSCDPNTLRFGTTKIDVQVGGWPA